MTHRIHSSPRTGQPDWQAINESLIAIPGALIHPVESADSFAVVIGDIPDALAVKLFESWRKEARS